MEAYVTQCNEDDEDCSGGSGSGSGRSSGDDAALVLCMNGVGKVMKVVGCEPEGPSDKGLVTPVQVITTTPQVPDKTEPGIAGDEGKVTTSKAAGHVTPTTASSAATNPPSTRPVEVTTAAPVITTTHVDIVKINTPGEGKTTTDEISTKANNPGKNNVNDQSKDGPEKEEDDKTWMIGVIVGCVIGSAILGVLAAIIVIKLKFSGQQSGSYQANERGSTASSSSASSQKPLYV